MTTDIATVESFRNKEFSLSDDIRPEWIRAIRQIRSLDVGQWDYVVLPDPKLVVSVKVQLADKLQQQMNNTSCPMYRVKVTSLANNINSVDEHISQEFNLSAGRIIQAYKDKLHPKLLEYLQAKANGGK